MQLKELIVVNKLFIIDNNGRVPPLAEGNEVTTRLLATKSSRCTHPSKSRSLLFRKMQVFNPSIW